MTIEDKIFARKRIIPARAEEYGFTRTEGGSVFCADFMDGDFTAVITASKDGSITGKVIDKMNDEEYTQLRIASYTGAYVGTVRAAYEELLADIADHCCTDVTFAADQSNRITGQILSKYGISPDFPWDDQTVKTYGVFRHSDSRKWFGLIMDIRKDILVPGAGDAQTDVINLKSDAASGYPVSGEGGIYQGYHMNHKKWISVLLDDTLPDDKVMELVSESYELTKGAEKVMDEALIRRVLELADSIPAGKVATYGQIARLVGRERNARLIGRIMRMADRYGDHPCHRVVNSSGRTVPGWKEQRQLLEEDGVTFRENGCVDMKKHQWEV